MPKMNLDVVEFKVTKNGTKVIAKEFIKKGTNLGPVFMIKNNSGDYKRDFIRTKLGQYMRQNHYRGNLDIKPRQYKIYAIAARDIKPKEELILNQFPWQLPFYNKKFTEIRFEEIEQLNID